MASILDGLKNQWENIKKTVDQPPKPKETPEQRAESMKSLQHEKVQLKEEKAAPKEQSPVERYAPVMAEKAKQAEQQRQAAPPQKETPTEKPATQKEVVPTKLDHKPEQKTTPTIAQPNVSYVATPTGNKAVTRPTAPVAQPQQPQPKQMQEYNSKLKESSPLPHERMAAKLDKAPAEEAKKVAQTRADTGKKLEFYSDVHKPKQGIKP